MRPTAIALLCLGCAPAPIVSPLDVAGADVGPDRPEYLVNPSDRSDNMADVPIATDTSSADASSADTTDASSADTTDASSADTSSADTSSADITDASSADTSSADTSSADITDASSADVRAADAPDARPLMCPRGFEFDTCPTGPTQPCCAVDARTTIPLGCGCLTAPFECTPRGRTGCP